MTSKLKTLVASTSVMALLLSGAPAMAAGTQAGTPITNTVSVTFEVGGLTQTAPAPATDTFVVDRKIIFDVAATDAVSTVVNPNSTNNYLYYTLQNTSNDTLDFDITMTNAASGFTPTNGDAGGNDNFDANNLQYCIDVNQNDACDGSETWGTTANVENLAPDSEVNIIVRGDFPANSPDGAVSAVTITAVALDSLGAALTNHEGVNDDKAVVQNVFADTGNDNTETADDNYKVAAAVLAVQKLSRVVSDPINGISADAKAIPGAVVEYCITVNNTGTAAASNVVISDNLAPMAPSAVFNSGFTPLRNGTGVSGGVCNTDGTADSSAYNSGTNTISSTLTTVPSNSMRTLIFQVTIAQ